MDRQAQKVRDSRKRRILDGRVFESVVVIVMVLVVVSVVVVVVVSVDDRLEAEKWLMAG